MEPPQFIAPPPVEVKIDPRMQEVFDDCGACADCYHMRELGLVK